MSNYEVRLKWHEDYTLPRVDEHEIETLQRMNFRRSSVFAASEQLNTINIIYVQ